MNDLGWIVNAGSPADVVRLFRVGSLSTVLSLSSIRILVCELGLAIEARLAK